MNRFRTALERYQKNTVAAAQTRIPAEQLINQVLPHALPPTGDTGQGYTPDPDAVTRVSVRTNSAGSVYSRRRLNLIEGAGVTLTVADDGANEEVDITVASPATDAVSLLDRFRAGLHAAELFTLTNGVNEFDLWYIGGTYYLAYDNKTETKLRSASTVAGLSGASDTTPVANGRYPALYYDGTTWHLWVWIAASTVTRHYTASTFTGSYSLSDSLASNLADVHVRKSTIDGLYYAGYKDVGTLKIGILRASALAGAWTDLGYVFDTIGRASWLTSEEADPAPCTWGNRAYVAFSGYDGTRQRAALVEVDPVTWQALAPAVVIVDPLETWQQRNSNQKVFNPVFLQEPSGLLRLYYAQNPNAAGTATGWSYVEAQPPPPDGRRAWDALRFDPTTARDSATGILATTHGSASVGPGGMVTSSSTGGAYGKPAVVDLSADFTIQVEFTAASFPSGGNYALLCRISTTNSGVDPIAALWIAGTGPHLYAEVHRNNGSGNLALTGSATLATGVRYRATLRKAAGTVALFLNGASDASGSHSGALTGLTEWTLSSQKGVTQAAAQQFDGTIAQAAILAEALPLSRV